MSSPKSPINPWFYRLALAGTVFLYLVLAIGTALTKRPLGDEGFMANPALDVLARGSTGVTAMEPTGNSIAVGQTLPGITEHLYLAMPFPIYLHAAWYKIFGAGIFSTRMVSIAFGLLALGACWVLTGGLTGNRMIALLATFFLTIDYAFIFAAADGRADMMAGAFSLAALAAYVHLRERSLNLAVLVSQTFLAAGIFSHPNAGLGFFGILLLALYFDRNRLRLVHIGLAAIPFACFALGWALYILPHPDDFRLQFGANLAGRWQGVSGLLMSPVIEIRTRYLELWYLPSYATGLSRLRVLIPVLYLAAFVGCLVTRSIRQAAGSRVLLTLTALYFLCMSVLEGHKNYYYLIHIVPFFAAVFGTWTYWSWSYWSWTQRRFPKLLVLCCAGALVFLQLSWAAYNIRRNLYRNSYLPTVEFVKRNATPTGGIVGSLEMGFGLGFFGNFKDDATLGFYTHRQPELVIVDERNYGSAFEAYKTTAPEVHHYMTKLLGEKYSKVFEVPGYQVFQRIR